MKLNKILSAMFCILLFAVSSTAIGKESIKQEPVFIRQTVEDCYTAIQVPMRTASDYSFTWCEGSLIGSFLAGIDYIFPPLKMEDGTPITCNAVFGGLASGYMDCVKQRTFDKFTNIPREKIQRSQIRAELTILNTTNRYGFTFANRQQNFVAERILDRNDVFVGGQVGYFVAGVQTAVDPAYELLTYGNPTVLATNAGATQQHFDVLWNSKMTLQTGTDVTRPIPTNLFYNGPRSQQSSATTRDSKNQYDGYLELGNCPIISGSADFTTFIDVPTFPTIAIAGVTSGWTTRLIVIFDGYNVYNAAEYGYDMKSSYLDYGKSM